MKKSKLTTKQIVLTGMMTAVLAVLSIVTIPLPTGVPVTLQTFAMAFCGYVLGWKLGGASSALYLILGAIGVPVYAGMSGGFGALLGPAGGFIFGFIPMAMLCGAGIKKGFLGKPFVLGIAGLQGHGQTELLNAISGLYPLTKGEIIVNGKTEKIKRASQAIQCGVALVPADRKRQGLML